MRQVTALSQAAGLTYLTFTRATGMMPQRVLVSAVDDGLDGIELSTIRHQVTSTGGTVYAELQPTSRQLTVTVYDDETPGVVVQQTDGSTVVVENGAADTYRVRLTQRRRRSDVTLTLRTDKQTFLDSSAAGFAGPRRVGHLGLLRILVHVHAGQLGRLGRHRTSARTRLSPAPTACSRRSRRRTRTSSRFAAR